MDLGGLFHGIGDFLGGIFGGGQKKQQQKPQQSAPRPAAAPVQRTVTQVNTQAPQQNTVKVPDPFALPAAQPLIAGGVTQHPAQPTAPPARPTVAMPTNPFPMSSQALQQQFQAQRQQEAANAAAPLAADPIRDRLAHAAQKSAGDTLDLINSNPVTGFLASIPQNAVKAGMHLANDLGANVGTNITDPITRKLLNLPDGNVGDTRQAGNETAQQLDGVFGDGKGTGISTAPQPVKDLLGVGSDVLNLLPGASLLKPVREAVVGGADALAGANKAKDAAIIAKDPTSSITSTPNTGKAPAITSPNRPAPAPITPTTLEAPKPVTAPEATAPAPVVTEAPKPVAAPVKATATEPTAELGSITRNAVRDGSINTPEGVANAVAQTTTAAKNAATTAGDTIENIIKKGDAAWEASHGRGIQGLNDGKPLGRDITAAEAESAIKGFTPAQQEVYKAYSQELGTLRDRSGHSLKGGNQGGWYGPHQFVDDSGASQAYDPNLVNEIRRSNAKTDVNGNTRDYSTTPFEHYIQRYADAPNAGSQRLVDAVENKVIKNGKTRDVQPTDLKVSDEAKGRLQDNLKQVTDLRDNADRLRANGDEAGAKQALKDAQNATNKAFNDFIKDIPEGADKAAAIKNVKELRGNYDQTIAQTLTLSNVVNRAADQGTKVVEAVKAPFVRGVEKLITPIAKAGAMPGAEVNALNTSRAASKAAKQTARGTLSRQIADNAKATVSMAGAGRNPIVKGIAKVDAAIRAVGGAATESGDLATRNAMEALRIGASRPEAAGLKTVADYKQYFNDYMQTSKYQDDLARVEKIQNPKIGLAGGEFKQNGGKVSTAVSKYADNGIQTGADALKPGLGKNRAVREVNDYVKGNITGYAGVTTRILGSVVDAALPIRPLRAAIREAASGDPAAVARATTMAAHAIVDSGAAYGTAGATALTLKSGLVGYTGAQPKQGSSASANNKANNVPANQWYINVGDNRVYFDPARVLGAPGVAADIVGSAMTGSNPGTSAENITTQIANQAGGNSIPQTIVNAQTYFNPATSDADKKYAGGQLQSTLAPSTGILNNVANWTDPTKRAPTNFVDDLKSNIPVLRSQTPAATDSRGNVIPNSKQASGGSSIFSVGKNTDSSKVQDADPVQAEINRLQKAGNDVQPTSSNTNAKNDNTTTLAKGLLNNPLYKSADDKTKATMLKSVVDGTAVKGISTSLKENDQQALVTAKLLGDKKDAWLDDNKNASDYYTADYDNQKANGTLTQADEDLTNAKGAHYKALAAQADQSYGTTYQMKQDYGKTSQSELKSLLNPKSDSYDPDAAQKLYDYDQARVKAGLPPKYNIDKIKAQFAKAAADAGNKAPKSFSFASLPTSLVGTGAGTGSTSNYAKPESLYQPIASLKTPASVSIPQGRSISVSKVQTL